MRITAKEIQRGLHTIDFSMMLHEQERIIIKVTRKVDIGPRTSSKSTASLDGVEDALHSEVDVRYTIY